MGRSRIVQLVPIGSATVCGRGLLLFWWVWYGFFVVCSVGFLYVGLERRVGYDFQFRDNGSQGVYRHVVGGFSLLVGASAEGGVALRALVSTRYDLGG